MSSGYVFIESNPKYPDRVRCLQQDTKPEPTSRDDGDSVRYIARFANAFRGHQQVQGLLSQQLIDSDQGLFRAELLHTIATIETCPISSERVWIDPTLGEAALQELDEKIKQHKAKRRQRDKLWQLVGFGFVGLFVIMLMFMLRTLNSA